MLKRLIHGDFLVEADKLIAEGVVVDAIITDPPFGTTACKWDCVIPFEEMWPRLSQLIKPNGAILLFGTEPFSSTLRMSNPKQFRYDWYWQKDKGANFLFANKMPLKNIEIISVFYKRLPIYNPQKRTNPKGVKASLDSSGFISKFGKEIMGNGWKAPRVLNVNRQGKTYEPDKLLPQQLIYFARDQRGKVHPTQKPVTLMTYLVKTYTDAGETVLDFTMGSGSTGVACQDIGRHFIGIERDPDYYEIAVGRMSGSPLEATVPKPREVSKRAAPTPQLSLFI